MIIETLITQLPSIIAAVTAAVIAYKAYGQSRANNVEVKAAQKAIEDNTVVTEDTHKVVNSRMDDYKRTLDAHSTEQTRIAVALERLEGNARLLEAVSQERKDVADLAASTPPPADFPTGG